MKLARALLLLPLLLPMAPANAAVEDDGWPAFGHALTLVQMFVRIAAQSSDPNASLKAMDDVLAGRNTEANRAMAGILEEATADMPADHRAKVASIGRDLAALARKEAGKPRIDGVSADRAPVESERSARSLQARKDLNAMGLRYFDASQYLDAVKRDDALAVELFILGEGVNLSSRDQDGRSAQDIARANGNARIQALLARSLPAAR
jgi:hypothetical protein